MGHNHTSRHLVRAIIILAIITTSIILLLKNTAIADTASHSPGIPQPTTALWQEDFETLPYGTPPPLTSDSGQDMYGNGVGYSTDPHWQQSYLLADTLAYSLGIAQNNPDPAQNHAVVPTTSTSTDTGLMPNNGNTMLRTSGLMLSAGHYYRASAWFATTNCTRDTGIGADPELTVGLYTNNGIISVAATSPTSPCSAGTKQYLDASATPLYTAQYATDIFQLSLPLSYSAISLELRNTQLSVAGNTSAYDLPAVHDATPSLDQSFSTPTPSGSAGFTSTLTYYLTNTAELAAKPSMSFTNTLPYGITPIASSASSTCKNQHTSINAQQVNFSGSLDAGDTSCTFSIEVSVPQSGTYTNDIWAFADYGNTGYYKPWGLLDPSPATLTVTAMAQLELSAATSVASVDTAAQNVIYSFSITNTGNIPLSNLALDYSDFSGDTSSISPMTCSETPLLGLEDLTLQPSQTVQCFFTYTVAQSDIDRHGGIDLSSALVTGTTEDQSPVASNAVTLHVAAGTTPSLTLSQIATRTTDTTTPLLIGETITYSFVVTNISHATIRDITIDSTAFSGTSSLDISCPESSLAPFEIMSCTATYLVTATDLVSTDIISTANARGIGTDETVDTLVTSTSDTTELPGSSTPSLVITNSHTPLPAGNTWAGDQLEYIFTVANTGNTPLSNVEITSDVHNDNSIDTLSSSDCPDLPYLGTLAPGEIITCKAYYPLTQDDIDRGETISSTASATGTSSTSGGITTSATDHEDIYPVTAPDLTLTRTAPSQIKDGDIAYIYNIFNNGNTTLSDVSLHDDIITDTTPACTWPSAANTLAPAETATCTATYHTTGTDILAASPIKSSASATGTDPHGKIASSISTVTTAIVRGEPATISGHLYMDHNMNWHFDAQNNEPRIADTEIQLTGTDIYGNTVQLSTLTNERGEYSFTGLYPGTYTAVRPRNSYNHISVSSTSGYHQVNIDGNPLMSPKNGTGSAEDTTISKDLIVNIQLDEGDHNEGNDFGETCGSIGNHIWMDTDRDGYVDAGEPGLEGVEVALYLDADGDGTEDQFIRTTLTDVNGDYYFSVLDLNYRDQYLIQITDGNGALSQSGLKPTFTATQTDFHFDNCSSNVTDGVAYADTAITVVESDTHATWFDWMKGVQDPDLRPASTSLLSLSSSSVTPLAEQLADDSLVSRNSNLTADFGFMTLLEGTTTNPLPESTPTQPATPTPPNTGAPSSPLFQPGTLTIHTHDCLIATILLLSTIATALHLHRHHHCKSIKNYPPKSIF